MTKTKNILQFIIQIIIILFYGFFVGAIIRTLQNVGWSYVSWIFCFVLFKHIYYSLFDFILQSEQFSYVWNNIEQNNHKYAAGKT